MPTLNELGAEELHAAMNNYLKSSGAPLNSQYEFTFVDLDENGRRDALVLMKLPYTYWCGWAGCPLLVFRADAARFSFISRTENVRGPVFIAHSMTNNMRDIILRTSGTNTPDRNVVLNFDGTAYTKNALSAPRYNTYPSSQTMEKFFR